MPNTTGKFYLYSDTSKFANLKCIVPNTEWQSQAHHICNKRLPEAMRNYSVTELELCGLAINIASFFHLLKRVILMQLVITYHSLSLSRVKQNLLPLR